MLGVTTSGSFKNTDAFFKRMQSSDIQKTVKKYGVKGMDALSNATPEDTGETAKSWKYEVTKKPGEITIGWHNTHEEKGLPIAILVQYGHATRDGGYIPGRDFVNPAMRPVFDQISDEVWRQVTK